MDQGIGMILLAVLGVICLVALFLVLGVLFPAAVERTRKSAETSLGRSFLLGLVNFVFVVAIGMGLGALGQNLGFEFLGVIVALLAIALIVVLTFGLAGVVEVVGERLVPDRGRVRQTGWGTAALALGCLTPYVGWFGLLPFVALTGIGAFVMGWYSNRAGARSTAELAA
ncbi:MAG: hypothetical protein A2Z66_02960 [Chloroflexi bacterium RBG_13_66_10]|nr:MAG: hypothetical protein A2Z66_02960 [Chloroflexi bacterium RBG_13_66_10]